MSLLVARRGILAAGAAPAPAPSGDYEAAVLADSPTGYWRLEETSGTNLADETETLDGTSFGADLDVDGKVGSAAACDGVDDYLLTALLGDVASLTIECWVRAEEGAGDAIGDAYLFGVIDDTSDNIVQLALLTDGTLAWRHRTSGSGGVAQIESDTAIDDGAWHHIVGIIETGIGSRLYIDGSPEAFGEGRTGTLNLAATRLTFGGDNNRGTARAFVECRIDEPATYATHLPVARIATHIEEAGDTPPTSNFVTEVNADSPVGWWRITETSGSTVEDHAGTNDGTNNGADLDRELGVLLSSGAGFNKTSDYIDCGINAYDLGVRRHATFGALVKPRSTGGSDVQDIFSDWVSSQGMTMRVNGSGLEAFVYPDNYRITTGSGLVEAGVPFHLALVLDDTELRLYQNGIEVGSTALGGELGDSTGTLLIGARGDKNSSQFFGGILSELYVIDSALSQARIEAHAQAAGF